MMGRPTTAAARFAGRLLASSTTPPPPRFRLDHHLAPASSSRGSFFFSSSSSLEGGDSINDAAPPAGTTAAHPPPTTVDVCIVGGGVVGTALACALKTTPMTSHLSVMLADRAPPPSSRWLDDLPAQPEARVSALTPASCAMLRDVGAWDRIVAARACPFTAMQVWDARAAGHVRYAAAEVGEPELGHVVENRVVHTALYEAATRLGVHCPPPAALASLNLGDSPGHLASVVLEEQQQQQQQHATGGIAGGGGGGGGGGKRWDVKARLVVGADGARSNVRQLAGLRAPGWRYGLKAAVGTVRTAAPHTTAWQRFLPDGPLALLPVGAPEDGWSNVVWTNTPSEADRIVKLSDEEFAAEVNDALRGLGKYAFDSGGGGGAVGAVFDAQQKLVSRVLRPATEAAIAAAAGGVSGVNGVGGGAEMLLGGPSFETPPEIVGASGMRGAFPLATQHAGRYVLRRLALVGDAAHQVHPLGGQGVNLGIRDAGLLVDALATAVSSGGDIGSVGGPLDEYASRATAANLPMMAALDGLQKLFAAEAPLVTWARGAGLAGVNALGPVRRQIAKYAMGGA